MKFLYYCTTSKNLDYPYWNYEKFDLEKLSDEECWSDYRFYKNDIYELQDMFGIPEEITTYNRLKVDGVEALCIFLDRFAYPCRYSDMIPKYARPVPQFSIISNQILNILYGNFHHLLENLNQPWLSPQCLEEFCEVIHRKGAALDHCWGFVDGTVRPISRPNQMQRVLYNGHKKVHAIKCQPVAAPNGLNANLFGSVEGKKHDSTMLAQSHLYAQFAVDTGGRALCIYGDPAYPLRPQLQAPFRNAILTLQQIAFNKSMSQVRISVEWLFGDIVNWFSFMDFKKNLKIGLSCVGKMYMVCSLLKNARTCLYGSMTSNFFNLDPPELRQYFI